MKFKLSCTLSSIVFIFASCGKPQNKLPSEEKNEELEQKINSLSNEVATTSANDRNQEATARLTQKTIGETNTYLNNLYTNINSTRPQDLPEWQEMYEALTQKHALDDPKFVIGARKEPTNIYHLNTGLQDNKKGIDALNQKLDENIRNDQVQQKTLETILARLDTIDRNIADFNKTMDNKFAAVDKVLNDYNGRIDAVENRMKTAEIALDQFRSEFVPLSQKVQSIKDELTKYGLATMHQDIKDLKKVTATHEKTLIDLDTRVKSQQADINTARNDLKDTDTELSAVRALAGGFSGAINDTIARMQLITNTSNTQQQSITDLNTRVNAQRTDIDGVRAQTLALETNLTTTQNLLNKTRTELTDTDLELSGVATELGTVRVTVADILVRIQNCCPPPTP